MIAESVATIQALPKGGPENVILDPSNNDETSVFYRARQSGLVEKIVQAYHAVPVNRGNHEQVIDLRIQKGDQSFNKDWIYVVLSFEGGTSVRLRIICDDEGNFQRFNDFEVSLSDEEKMVLNSIINNELAE